MKKFLLLPALALCAMTANADNWQDYFQTPVYEHNGAQIENCGTIYVNSPYYEDEDGSYYECLVNVGTIVDDLDFTLMSLYCEPAQSDLDNELYGYPQCCVARIIDADGTPDAFGNCFGMGTLQYNTGIYGFQIQFHLNMAPADLTPSTYEIRFFPTDDDEALFCFFITFDKNASVSNLDSDSAAKEYYNLQGMKIANPENGLYIVRQGDKTWKEIRK